MNNKNYIDILEILKKYTKIEYQKKKNKIILKYISILLLSLLTIIILLNVNLILAVASIIVTTISIIPELGEITKIINDELYDPNLVKYRNLINNIDSNIDNIKSINAKNILLKDLNINEENLKKNITNLIDNFQCVVENSNIKDKCYKELIIFNKTKNENNQKEIKKEEKSNEEVSYAYKYNSQNIIDKEIIKNKKVKVRKK